MKCALYARVSTQEQAKNYSIPAQLDLLRNFAQANNYEIFKEYVDAGISGTTSDRPQLRELFNDAKRGYFKILLVYRIDRFFRSTLKLLNAVDELQKTGVSFRFITEPFDTSNPLGNFMISVFASIAQLERDILIERSKMGVLKSVQEGHYMASVPLYGYKYDREIKNLKIHPEESEVVKLIFAIYQEPHLSQVKIAKKLNDMGYFCRKGGKWHAKQIHRVLINSAYCGKWRYGTDSESVLVDIPRLVSDETFNEIQELLKKRRVGCNRNQKYDYLLINHLYCGICKRRMTVRTRKSVGRYGGKTYGPYFHQHYYCFGRTLKQGCTMGWIRKDKIESLVWHKIQEYVKNPGLIRHAMQENDKRRQDKLTQLKGELIKITNEIERLELEEEKILNLYRKEMIDEAKLSSQMKKTNTEKQALNQKKAEIELQIESGKYLKTRLNALEDLINRIQNNIDSLTYEKKQEIIDLLINKIFVNGNGKVQLELVLPNFCQSTDQQPT